MSSHESQLKSKKYWGKNMRKKEQLFFFNGRIPINIEVMKEIQNYH